MKKITSLLLLVLFSTTINAQVDETTTDIKLDKKKILAELSEKACKCIDSIETAYKTKDSISSEIHVCIDDKVGAYQMIAKLSDIPIYDKNSKESEVKKEFNISININKDSKEYKEYYFEMERYLVENCPAIRNIIAANDIVGEKSLSRNHEAMKYYQLGLDESKDENFEKAIEYYKKAVVFDKNFAFAYDNMGICYRRLNKYDEAIDAYEKSLKIDPNGTMPLQNIAVAYQYKKEFKKAVKAYENLAKLDKENPEVYYGIGLIYNSYLFDYEKALDNLCKAYNIYAKQKSPYRTDAETLIQNVYRELKKQGKEKIFDEILEKNNISPH